MMTNINFESVPAPQVKPGRDRQAEYVKRAPERQRETRARFRQNNPESVLRSKQAYREAHGTQRREAVYLGRPFCAWDGEGVTLPGGAHIYNLFSGKCGDDTTTISREAGLRTEDIFETLLEFGAKHPDAIHIIYGGSYDFNMWVSDLQRGSVFGLYHNKFLRWKDYRLSWRRGKSFYVCRVDEDGKRVGAGVTVYDIISFFQSSFVAACDSYLGDRFIHRDMIVANKAARGTFHLDDLDTVTDYNIAELDNLILLANELRERLNKVGLRPRRWDSCGAIAAALMTQHGISNLVKSFEIPEEVGNAERHAYAGGRFEMIRYGHTDEPVYEYDVNSAYPSALRNVPDLSKGKWHHATEDCGPKDFAVYHIESHTPNEHIPAPLFRRDGNGTVCYPAHVTGWYWSPEYNVWKDYLNRGHSTGKVIEVWWFESDPDIPKPFAFIEPLYMKRRALKKAGDGAHVGIKLALNSLYGKLAQQVGAEQDMVTKEWRLPPFHCLSWAGYTTSHCRAAVLSAVIDDLDAVIAFETDAVFTTRPLNVKTGSNLGEFECLTFKDMTYVQSGMYFATDEHGNAIAKTRGVDRGELTREHILGPLTAPCARDRVAKASLTRFVGAGIALAQNWKKWRRWEKVNKNMVLGPTGKRIHVPCPQCTDEPGLNLGVLHNTMCPMLTHMHSLPFPVAWINPNPDMTNLDDMRNAEPVYE